MAIVCLAREPGNIVAHLTHVVLCVWKSNKNIKLAEFLRAKQNHPSIHHPLPPAPTSTPSERERERERERISYVSNSFQLCTGAAEINAFSAENLELFMDLSFKAFSRSEYSLACFAYCQEVYVSNFYLHSSSIFIFFNSSLHPTPQLALDVANAVFCLGPRNKIVRHCMTE